MIEAALYDLLNESIKVKKLSTQTETTEYFNRTVTYDNRFTKQNFCYSFGKGSKNCLFYTNSGDGQTIGGTALITLTNLLQRGTCNFRHMPVTWNFAPNTNEAEEIIKLLKPDFVFEMTKAPSTGENGGATFIVKYPLPEKHSNMIRAMYLKSGLRINSANSDQQMGEGFRQTSETEKPAAIMPPKCQFLKIQYGQIDNMAPADMVFLQMASGLLVVDSL
ncbi:MAG: hypothetical protein PHV05_04340 [Candidatus Riflebacteria bacterium]|nr:hypothetical protein [Candidatus Riflebacteria bacterium]